MAERIVPKYSTRQLWLRKYFKPVVFRRIGQSHYLREPTKVSFASPSPYSSHLPLIQRSSRQALVLLQIISSRRILYTPPDPSGRPGTNWVLDELGRVCASQADPHPKLFQLSCYYNFHCFWQLKAFQLASALENLKPSITSASKDPPRPILLHYCKWALKLADCLTRQPRASEAQSTSSCLKVACATTLFTLPPPLRNLRHRIFIRTGEQTGLPHKSVPSERSASSSIRST